MFPADVNNEELEAIISRLKRFDYAGYLSVRFSPIQHREALAWLYGFYIDVGQISTKVNEPLLGEIRLQWWRDQLLKMLRDEPVGHPVADGLAPFMVKFGEPLFKELIGIVDSFSFEIQKETLKTKDDLIVVLDKRHGGLLRAGLILSDVRFADQNEICSQAGIAIGMGELIAQLNGVLQKDIMPFPQDLMSKYDLFHEDFLPKKSDEPNKADKKLEFLNDLLVDVCVVKPLIKPMMKKVPRSSRAFLSRWLLVPHILKVAIADRVQGDGSITTLNPLRVFMVMGFRI